MVTNSAIFWGLVSRHSRDDSDEHEVTPKTDLHSSKLTAQVDKDDVPFGIGHPFFVGASTLLVSGMTRKIGCLYSQVCSEKNQAETKMGGPSK